MMSVACMWDENALEMPEHHKNPCVLDAAGRGPIAVDKNLWPACHKPRWTGKSNGTLLENVFS